MSDQEISVKGLDSFSKKFLISSTDEEEYISVSGGQKASADALQKYAETRKLDFIQRAGSFTEDLVAFVVEQKKMRELSDREVVFALALTNINLRNAYGSPQGGEKDVAPERREALLKEFDEVCWGAQQFWDANK